MSSLVIIPTYNERDNLTELTERIIGLDLPLDILFIDDNSPDGTGQLADDLAQSFKQISVLHRKRKLGYGSAVVEGFRLALERKYDWVLQMDADLSHDPAAIPRLLEVALEHDLVLGSRYQGGVRVIDWEVGRILLSCLANSYARFVTGLPIRDITTGFRCYRRSALEYINIERLKANGYGLLIETAYRVWQGRGRLAEVPIIYYGRCRGRSKLSQSTILEAAWIVWRLRLGSLLRRSRSLSIRLF